MRRKGKRLIRTFAPYVPAVGCFAISAVETARKQWDPLLVILGIGLLIGAIYIQDKRQSSLHEDEGDELIRYMNLKRHDWLNHIQVLMGYLSLNRPDRMQSYLQRLMTEAEQERYISDLGYAPLTHYLLTRRFIHQDIELDIQIIPSLTIKNDRQGERLLQTLREIDAFLQRVSGSPSGIPLKVGITLAAHQADIMLYVEFPEQAHPNHELIREGWTGLCKEVSSRHAEIMMEHDTPAMECAVRIS